MDMIGPSHRLDGNQKFRPPPKDNNKEWNKCEQLYKEDSSIFNYLSDELLDRSEGKPRTKKETKSEYEAYNKKI